MLIEGNRLGNAAWRFKVNDEPYLNKHSGLIEIELEEYEDRYRTQNHS